MDFTKCPARSDIVDALELLDHDANGCDECLSLVEPKKETPAEEEVGDVKPGLTPAVNPKKRKAAEMTDKKPNLLRMNRYQATRYLLKTEGLNKHEAALRLLNERKLQQAAAEPQEKEVVDKRDMPFCPPFVPLPRDDAGNLPSSVLGADDHRRYVAIISNNLKPETAVRFTHNNLELQGFDAKICEERAFFLKTALEFYDGKQKNPYNFVLHGSFELHKKHSNCRRLALKKERYEPSDDRLNWTACAQAADATLLKPKVVATLNSGHIPETKFLDPRRKCMLVLTPKLVRTNNPPTPVEEFIENDACAVDFVLQNNLDFLADACTVRYLLTEPWLFHDHDFAIKVEVRRKIIDGVLKRFAVVSKPVMARLGSRMSVQRDFLKWALKGTVRKQQKQKDSPPSAPASAVQAVDPAEPANSAVPGASVLDGILDSMRSESAEEAEVFSGTSKLRHCARRFSVLKFGDTVKHRMLCRSSNQGSDADKNPLSFAVKAEYLPSIGAEMLHAEEELWNYFTAVLKNSKVHLIYRVHPATGAVLQVERRTASSMYSRFDDAMRQLVSHRCQRLCAFMDFVGQLSEGSYLFERDGDSMKVSRSTGAADRVEGTRPTQETVPKPAEDTQEAPTDRFDGASPDSGLVEIKPEPASTEQSPPPLPSQLFQGLNVRIPLVWQIVQSRIPGSLLPAKPQHGKRRKIQP